MHSRGGPAVQTTPVVEAQTGMLIRQSELPAQVTPPQCSAVTAAGVAAPHCVRSKKSRAARSRVKMWRHVPIRCCVDMFGSLRLL
jgi:hypothetical protein